MRTTCLKDLAALLTSGALGDPSGATDGATIRLATDMVLTELRARMRWQDYEMFRDDLRRFEPRQAELFEAA
jgi:hypothetical protein